MYVSRTKLRKEDVLFSKRENIILHAVTFFVTYARSNGGFLYKGGTQVQSLPVESIFFSEISRMPRPLDVTYSI